jgi:hypothetical protein
MLGQCSKAQQRASVDECLVVAFAEAERVEVAQELQELQEMLSASGLACSIHAQPCNRYEVRGAWAVIGLIGGCATGERPLPN